MNLSDLVKETRVLNSRCMATWKKAITLPEKEMDIEMNKIWERLPRLYTLCQDLMDSGYHECLYEIKRCNEIPTCFVCPCQEDRNDRLL